MEPSHANPLEEGLSHGSQRVAQLASLTAAMAQVAVHRRTLHDSMTTATDRRVTRALRQQDQALHADVASKWAPAHDHRWLADADLIQTGQAWAAAATEANTNPAAASAMRKCEDHLRTLHPHAMTRYDRLRTGGLNPLEAMQQTAPLFARPPNTHVGDPPTVHPALTSATGEPTQPQVSIEPGEAQDGGAPSQAEVRGWRIAQAIQSRAIAAGQTDLGPEELTLVLDTITNLPDHVIARIVTRTAADDAPAVDGRSPAQLAAQSFPLNAADAVRTANSSSKASAAPQRVPAPSTAHMHRPV
jgi:hypothetical protein